MPKMQLSCVNKFFSTPKHNIHALKNINVSIEKGDIFGIIGKSGAGKSTLLRCFNLLERPTNGQILFDGEDLTKLSEKNLRSYRQKIGMIFQHFNLLNSKNVFENIALPLRISGNYSKKEIEDRVNHLLSVTKISDKKHQMPSQLSGGQKQRVAIARSLATAPDVLLCDEATSALDSETTHSILGLLKEINQTQNVTIVLITHELDVVRSICNRIAVIDQGSIVEENFKRQFFTNPQSEMGRALIRSSATFDFGF